MAPQNERLFTSDDYLAFARRFWLMILTSVLVGVALGIAATRLVTPTYVSSATVLVSQASADAGAVANGRSSGAINLDTEVQIAESLEVAQRAAGIIESGEDPRALIDILQVTVPANTAVLVITFSAPTAEAAQTGANAFAEAYLVNRAAVEKELTGEKIVPGRVLAAAPLPADPDQPKTRDYAAVGGMLGLLVGVGLAALRWRRDDRVNTTRDAERISGWSITAEMPAPSDVVKSRRDHDHWDLGIRTLVLRIVGPASTVPHSPVAILSVGCDAAEYLSPELVMAATAHGVSAREVGLGADAADGRWTGDLPTVSQGEPKRVQENGLLLITGSDVPTALDLLEVSQAARGVVLAVGLGSSTAKELRDFAAGLTAMNLPLIALITIRPKRSSGAREQGERTESAGAPTGKA